MNQPVILHVEDNPDFVEVVALAFENLGLNVELINAPTIESAINIIKDRRAHNQRVDLILIDMNLPDESGIDLIRRVKTNPAWAGLPIIVLSSQTNKETVAEAYALGANCYFPKLISDKSVFDVAEHLYSCWFELGILPNVTPAPATELLGRAIGVEAQQSEIYMKLVRRFSDSKKESGMLLRLSLMKSNHANLFAFFNLDNKRLPVSVLTALGNYVDAKEKCLTVVQRHIKHTVGPHPIDCAIWALQLEETFSPDAIALAAGCLFPNSPAATVALHEGTLGELDLILELAKLHAYDPEVDRKMKSLSARVERARINSVPMSPK